MTSRIAGTFRQFRDLLTREQTEIMRAAGLLMIPALLTKITGLLFQLLTSTQLGSSPALSEFLFANSLPQLLADVLLTGAISTLVIPIFIQIRSQEGQESFVKFFNTVVNLMLGTFAIVSLLVIIFAPQIFPFVLEHIVRATPAELAKVNLPQIIDMLRVLMIPQFILGTSVFLSAGLNVYDRLFLPQLAPLFYNVGRIFSVMFLLPLTDKSPWALVAGVVIGSILHLIIQIPLARMLGLNWSWHIDFHSKYLKNFLKVAWPRLIAYSADIISSTVSTLIIAGYQVIFLPVMFYTNSLIYIVPGVIGYAFSVASFSTISRYYQNGQFEEINDIVRKIINQILFLSIPIVITLVILRLPVVRLTFGSLPGTEFSRNDTQMVSWALMFAGIGIMFSASRSYLYRLFYAAQNTAIPMIVSLISLGLEILLTILFANLFSNINDFSIRSIDWNLANFFIKGDGLAAVGGVTLAYSVTALIEFLLMLILIHRYVLKLDYGALFRSIMLKLIPASVTAVLMYGIYKLWDTLSFPIDAPSDFAGSTTLNLFMLTFVTIFTSWMIYFLVCYLLNIEEIRILRRVLNPLFRLGGLRIS